MPKRIVDGEGLWKSDTLLNCEEMFRAEYANLIPLALSNGVFECNSRRIWSLVYSHNRPEITPEVVQRIIEDFHKTGLLFLWRQAEKVWGYWVGIEKPGRLPGESRRGTNEPIGPEPHKTLVQEYQRDTASYRQRPGYIYFIQAEETRRIKIGFAKEPFQRLKMLQTGSPDILRLMGVIPRFDGGVTEGELHRKFSKYISHLEWFEGAREIEDFIRQSSIKVEGLTDVPCIEIPEVDRKQMDSNGIQNHLGLGLGLGGGSGSGSGVGCDAPADPPATEEDSTQRKIGEYRQNEFGYLRKNPDKVYTVFVEKWQAIVGPGAICKKPFRNGWSWFSDTCAAVDTDTLVPAFELWATANANQRNDQPIGDFMRDLKKWTERVIIPKVFTPKSEDDDPIVKAEREAAITRDLEESQQRNKRATEARPVIGESPENFFEETLA